MSNEQAPAMTVDEALAKTLEDVRVALAMSDRNQHPLAVQPVAHPWNEDRVRGWLATLSAEVRRLRSACIIELACENNSVAEYMKHWDGRTEKAEAEVRRLRDKLDATETAFEYERYHSATLRADLAEMTAQRNEVFEIATAHGREVVQAKRDLAAAQERIKTLERDCKVAVANITVAHDKLEDARDERDKAQERIRQLEAADPHEGCANAEELRQEREARKAAEAERDNLKGILRSAHGALADARTVPVPGAWDDPIAEAIRALTDERDDIDHRNKQLKEELAAAAQERDRLAVEAERLRVQLVGCGVAAMGNTPEAIERNTLAVGSYGYSASYEDCLNAVRREVAERIEKERLDALVERAKPLVRHRIYRDCGEDDEYWMCADCGAQVAVTWQTVDDPPYPFPHVCACPVLAWLADAGPKEGA